MTKHDPQVPQLSKLPRDRPNRDRCLVIACGAVVREVQAVVTQSGLAGIDITAVPATYHNRPERIAPAVARRITQGRARGYARMFVAYADCGTQGALDQLLANEQVERLPGAHCYAFFSGVDAFDARSDEDVTSFFLTDFLARHFEALVIRGLGIDRHPELLPLYFGNYERVIYLSQAPTSELLARAEAAAARLGLSFMHRPVGYGDLPAALARAHD
jgi:Protein of unknown function (DUF1638)